MLNIQPVEKKCCREPVIAYQYCYCIISLTVLYVLVAKHKFQILGPLFKTNLGWFSMVICTEGEEEEKRNMYVGSS
jgi:hypothetical protein